MLRRVLEQGLEQAQAARQLGLSVQQVKRLCRRLREEGATGLISRRRGRRSNRRIDDAQREHYVALVRRHYADFGPLLAHEYLGLRATSRAVKTLARATTAVRQSEIFRADSRSGAIARSCGTHPPGAEQVQGELRPCRGNGAFMHRTSKPGCTCGKALVTPGSAEDHKLAGEIAAFMKEMPISQVAGSAKDRTRNSAAAKAYRHWRQAVSRLGANSAD